MQDAPLLIKISCGLLLLGVSIPTIIFLLSSLKKPVETFSILGGLFLLVFGAAWLVNKLGI